MKVLSFFGLLTTLYQVSNAAVLGRDDPYVGDLRTFGKTGCFNDNQGVGTFTMSMTSQCITWPIKFKSMTVHLVDGWKVHAFTTSNCTDEGSPISPTPSGAASLVCNNIVGDSEWTAYSVFPA